MATEAPARESVVAFRTTHAESREIDKAAHAAKMPRADYVRMKVLGHGAGASVGKPRRSGGAKSLESPRLKAVYELLRGAGSFGVTGVDIVKSLGGIAISTTISEVRRALPNGESISCMFQGITPSGAKIYRYVLK